MTGRSITTLAIVAVVLIADFTISELQVAVNQAPYFTFLLTH